MANKSTPLSLVGGLEVAVAAAGTDLATATALTGGVNVVTSATGTTADGVRLPADYPVGVPLYIINATATALDVWPPTGGTINGGSAGAAKALAANIGGCYVRYSSTGWGAVLSA